MCLVSTFPFDLYIFSLTLSTANRARCFFKELFGQLFKYSTPKKVLANESRGLRDFSLLSQESADCLNWFGF